MTLSEKEAALVEDYSFIENPMERFSVIVDQAKSIPPLAESERQEEDLVPGCSSQVWIKGGADGEHCHFQGDADSAIVRAVALLFVRLYDGCAKDEVASFEPTFLDTLRISEQLSPTRRNGMRQVQKRIIELTLGSSGS